jgi:hypothetical protein
LLCPNEFLLTTFVAFIVTLITFDEEIKDFYFFSLVVVLVKINFHNYVKAVFFVEFEKILMVGFHLIILSPVVSQRGVSLHMH